MSLFLLSIRRDSRAVCVEWKDDAIGLMPVLQFVERVRASRPSCGRLLREYKLARRASHIEVEGCGPRVAGGYSTLRQDARAEGYRLQCRRAEALHRLR